MALLGGSSGGPHVVFEMLLPIEWGVGVEAGKGSHVP